ncbi:hypothetical protein TNCV_286981 [Trichonephila clavipes]|nr:hypothetical protein TNCV_286981 [Trichonephila clavipes]
MTSHNRLDDFFRGRAVGRLEAGQSQVEVARSLQVARNWPPVLESIPNKWYSHQEGRPKISTNHQHLHRIATWL